MHLLILGGSGFTGQHQVRYALERGHRVTVFNRGQRSGQRSSLWGSEVEQLQGDRDTGDYTSLVGRRFDACIDNPSSVPHWVRDAGRVLKGQVDHFICISTLSVYASHATPGADETAARLPYEGSDAMAIRLAELRSNMALYGPLKALVEDEAHRQFAGHCTVIRPGLIVGPGDETDRFSYWPLRVQRGGAVLTPPLADRVSFIDARDLAEWTVRMAEQRSLGDFNAVGPHEAVPMGSLLHALRLALQSDAEWVPATSAFLQAEGVAGWSDLPVWLPSEGDYAGFHQRSCARAVQAGLTFRSIESTAIDFIAWWNTQDEARRSAPLRAGLSPEREHSLIKKLKEAA